MRNIIAFFGAVAVYVICFRLSTYALDWAGANGRTRLLSLLAFHIVFGVAGFVAFGGRTALRTGLVFLSVFMYGVGMEIISPDARHQGVQLFVSVPFAAIAAVASALCGQFKRKQQGEDHA